MINCFPVLSRKLYELSEITDEYGARCRQAVTSLERSLEMKFLFATLALALAMPLLAKQEGNWHPFDRYFDKSVTLQGLGWGLGAKGLGIRVMTADGVPIYLDPIDERIVREFEKWQGRLIEVSGILRKREMATAPDRAQGYTRAFEYLMIEDAEVKGIARVEFLIKAAGK